MIKINDKYDWKITAKKFLIYGLMALAVAYLILASLPQSAKIGIALGIIMAIINFIKNSGILKEEEMPILPATEVTEIKALRSKRERI